MSEQKQPPASPFVWHEIYTPDAQGSIDFYTKALGLGTSSMDMGEMGTYTMLTHNGVAFAGVADTTTPANAGFPPHWAGYLAVDDVDSRVALCVELGATVLVPPLSIPTVGRMALITDPQGANVWLFAPETMS